MFAYGIKFPLRKHVTMTLYNETLEFSVKIWWKYKRESCIYSKASLHNEDVFKKLPVWVY